MRKSTSSTAEKADNFLSYGKTLREKQGKKYSHHQTYESSKRTNASIYNEITTNSCLSPSTTESSPTSLQISSSKNLEGVTLVWYDPKMVKEADDTSETMKELRNINNYVVFHTDEQQCLDYMKSIENEKIFLVVSGQVSSAILEDCEQLSQVDTVFIFCFKPERYQHFLEKYPKLFGVYCKRNDLLADLNKNINLLEKQQQTFSFYQQHHEKAIRSLSKESTEFLWFQIFKDLLHRLPKDNQSKQQLIDFCQQYYRGNAKELKLIDEFKTTYTPQEAINWYTKDTFLYRLLNKALRTEDIIQLHTFRFFIVDLSSSLAREHQKIKERDKIDTVMFYRGFKLDKDELLILKQNEGGVISANGFFSTTRSIDVALQFAKKPSKRQNIISVLYEIECSNCDESVVFADIAQDSDFKREQEVLFDIGTTFRLQSVTENTSDLWVIKMQVTDEGSRIAKDYIELNRGQEELSVAVLFGKLLTVMGKYDESLYYFESLLSNESQNEDRARIYNNIGSIYREKSMYDKAIENYDRAYSLMMNATPEPRTKDSARPLINMGNVFRERGELDKALEFYTKALGIIHEFGEEHLLLAIALFHTGDVYLAKKNFLKSLKYYEKSLKIREKQLPSVHIRIAQCLTAIGCVYAGMQKLDCAIDYHQKALEMFKKVLPLEHNDIASCQMNIAAVLREKQEFKNALDYCLSALKIRQKVFEESKDHPQLVDTLRNIGLIYEDQENIILAQEYYEKALTMDLRLLPNGHPNLAIIEKDLARIKGKNKQNV